MKKNILVLIGAMLMLFSCYKELNIDKELPGSASTTETSKLFEVPEHPKYEEGVLLVKFKNNSQRSTIGKSRAQHIHTKTMQRYNDNGYFKIDVADVEKEVERLKNSSEVEWVSPNWTEKAFDFVPNDPYYVSGMYGLTNIKAPAAWTSGNVGKEDVHVVVIDEGVMWWHCDLNTKIWENPEEMKGTPGVDDDQNGYVDDFRGWNWFDGNNKIYTGNDDHGTHVAGTIGAKGNNGIGVVGVAPNVKIISLKFLADFGFDNHAIQAIDYAIDLKQRKGLNIKIMSNSWGGGGFNQGLVDAINRAKTADILFVAAAGNANNNNDANPAPSYPSSYPNENIIAVGASDENNNKAGFSSYGKTTVDIFAPGVRIQSTLPSATHTPSYGSYSGTSMATPHVSGGLALLSSVHPEYTAAQLKSTLMSTVTLVAGLSTYCVTGGVMNVSSFTGVTNPVIPDATCGTAPILDTQKPSTMFLILDSITENHVTGYATFHIRWQKPTDNSQIIGLSFNMVPPPNSWTWFLQGNEWPGYGFSVPMNQAYQIYGRAKDSWGNYGDPSNVIIKDYTGTPPPEDQEPPSVPQNLRSSDIGELSFRLTWDASTDNNPGVTYKVSWKKAGNVNPAQTTTSATSYLVNVFTEPNTTYECWVEAKDAADNYSTKSNTVFVTTLGGTPPPPVACNITSSLSATSQGLAVNVGWANTITGDCTISSTRLERKSKIKGVVSPYAPIAFNPTSAYIDNVSEPGQYTYRLMIQSSTGQTFYSNAYQVQVKRR